MTTNGYQVWIDSGKNFPRLRDFLEVYRSDFAEKDDDGPNYESDGPEYEFA